MRVQPTTVMLLGFAGIVAYLMISSAKKTAQGSGSVLATGGGTQGAGTLPAPVAYRPASTSSSAVTQTASTAQTSSAQAATDTAGPANLTSDFASWISQS